jgi:ABC-type sugar transport system substrate-binding protein
MGRHALLTLTSLSLVLSFESTGCGHADSGPPESSGTLSSEVRGGIHGSDRDRQIRIAWLAADPNNTYDAANLSGAADRLAGARKQAADSNGIVQSFYSAFDPAEQLRQCDEVVASGEFDAIIVIPADGASIVPCVNRAGARGIPVVAADLPIGTDPATVEPQTEGQVGAVLTPAAKFGVELAPLVVEACSALSTCNVVYIAGAFGIAFDVIALQQLDTAAAAHPNIRIVAREEAYYDEALAYSVMRDVLTRAPDVNVVIGAGDQMARGAAVALAEAPPAAPVKIVGAGAGAYAVNEVRAERWYATFVTLPYDEGSYAAEVAIRAVHKTHVPHSGIDPVSKKRLPAFFSTDNLDAFRKFTPQWPG